MNKHIIVDPRLEKRFLPQISDLDQINFKLEHPRNWIEISESRSDLYTLIRRGEEVLGYVLIMPLRRPTFEALKSGTLGDYEVGLRDLSENPAGIYVASVASSPRIRNKFGFIGGLLVGIVGGQIAKVPTEVLAIPISRVGEHMARILQMEELQEYDLLPGVEGYQPRIFRRDPFRV
jgi:hypothetical protein